MKKFGFLVISLITMLASCVSLSDKEISVKEQAEFKVIGSVTAEFNSFQFFHFPNQKNLKNKAYLELKKTAQSKYDGNVDIRNITITGSGSALTLLPNVLPAVIGGSLFYLDFYVGMLAGIPITGLGLLIGNIQKITAMGDVVVSGSQTGSFTANQMEGALNKAAETLIDSMPRNASIAILSVYSDNRETAEYVIDELEYKFVDSKKFKIVDRRRLEQIRREQNFQLSGEVDDNSAVSIGNMLGASVVITGNISGSGSSRRLILKALDVKTAQIVTMARERF